MHPSKIKIVIDMKGHDKDNCFYCILGRAAAPMSALDVLLEEIAANPGRSHQAHWHTRMQGHSEQHCFYCWLLGRVSVQELGAGLGELQWNICGEARSNAEAAGEGDG